MTKAEKSQEDTTETYVVACALTEGRYRGGKYYAHGRHEYELTEAQVAAVKRDPYLAIADAGKPAPLGFDGLSREEALTTVQAGVEYLNTLGGPTVSLTIGSQEGQQGGSKGKQGTGSQGSSGKPATGSASGGNDANTPPATDGLPDTLPYRDLFITAGMDRAAIDAAADAGKLAGVKGLNSAKAAEVDAWLTANPAQAQSQDS